MLGFNIYAADSDEEARFLSTSMMQTFANLRRGTPGRLPPPRRDIEDWLQPGEADMLRQSMAASAIGARETVKSQLQSFIAQTEADELILAAHIYDHEARLKSYSIAAEARAELAVAE
jgi:alkanesulfonate monooxygenase SsuD/methylene tetrahydromethanopterin reductase-like flavin-dependent oxidoreductase (luciferase family)